MNGQDKFQLEKFKIPDEVDSNLDKDDDPFRGSCNIHLTESNVTSLSKQMRMSNVNGFILLASAFLNAYDVYNDFHLIILQYQIYQDKKGPIWPYCWNLLILFSCALLKIVVSFCLYIDFDKKTKRPVTKLRWLYRFIVHALLIAPTIRFIEAFYYGVKCNVTIKNIWGKLKRKDDVETLVLVSKEEKTWKPFIVIDKKDLNGVYVLYKMETLIASYLYVLETYLENAPQLVLRIYLFTNLNNFSEPSIGNNIFGVTASMASIAWSLVSHFRTEEEIGLEYESMSLRRSIFWTLFQFFFIASRILSLSLFASVFSYFIFPVCLIHWMMMIIFILFAFYRGTNSRSQIKALIGIFALIYIFNFINLNKDQYHRNCAQIYLYHFIMFIENVILISLWFVFCGKPADYYMPLLITHYVSFILGLILMVVFFGGIHLSDKFKIIKQVF